jgi:asparagine synthase (glutamine-hydrolysing)
VLAVATRVARRERVADPIPATNRFPGAEGADETEWQERVVAHLGLDEWLRIDHDDELDCVGPVAQEALRTHGLLWPFNAHFHVPLLRAAAGGSLLTGVGGDELVSEASSARAFAVVRGRERPRPRDLLHVGYALAPQPLRRAVLRRRFAAPFPWLRPAAVEALTDAWAGQAASEPARWSRRLAWIARLRYVRVGTESLRLLADDAGAAIAHPFLDRGFGQALAREPRFRDRTAGMRALFHDLLPDDLLARETKASFDRAFWNRWSRGLAASWDGGGVDETLVDADALRAEWQSDEPDPRSYLLAQSVWLAQASAASRAAAAGSSESHDFGRRSSQAGSAARSSSAAGSRGGIVTPR